MTGSRRLQSRAVILSATFAVLFGTTLTCANARERAFRAFDRESYWNSPLPADAPVDPNSDAIIAWLKRDNDPDHIKLGGTGPTGRWGMPIYWAGRGDPTWNVRNTCSQKQPGEFDKVRIPVHASPDPTSDAAMTVFDRRRGLVYGFHKAHFDTQRQEWGACGGTVYYLSSLGLDGRLSDSDERRNFGHRGFPPPSYAVRLDEVQAGSINHVLKIAVATTRCQHVFPAVGDECGTTAADAPPEGTRIRIKPSVNLEQVRLSPAARVIATALQRYGAVIGDQSGGSPVLKLENTVAEGRGQRWKGRLTTDALAGIPLGLFEVIKLGYGS
jgi:hypothetical protein